MTTYHADLKEIMYLFHYVRTHFEITVHVNSFLPDSISYKKVLLDYQCKANQPLAEYLLVTLIPKGDVFERCTCRRHVLEPCLWRFPLHGIESLQPVGLTGEGFGGSGQLGPTPQPTWTVSLELGLIDIWSLWCKETLWPCDSDTHTHIHTHLYTLVIALQTEDNS